MSYKDKIFLKIILAGEAGVGKTSLRRKYLGQGFQKDHLSTIGADFASLMRQIGDKKTVFQIWDIAGQDIFQRTRSMYYRGTLGALIVFDLTNLATFKAIDKWIKELEENTGRGIVPFFIIGNKADLLSNEELNNLKRKISTYVSKLNQTYADRGIKVQYFLTSALTGDNVNIAFEILGEQILEFLEKRKKKRDAIGK